MFFNMKTAKGELVPLASLVKLEETVGPRELNHFSQRRAVKISAGLAEDVSIDEGLKKVIGIAGDILPENSQLDFDGQSREYFEAKDTLTFVFVLAVIFDILLRISYLAKDTATWSFMADARPERGYNSCPEDIILFEFCKS